MATMTIKEVAEKLGRDEHFIRYWIRQGTCPFGFYVPHEKRSEYIISEKKFKEYF